MAAEVTGVFASRALAAPVQITFDWTTSLKQLPKICMKDVETFVTSEKAPKSGLTKGYKFFCKGFIHEFQGQQTLQILRAHLFPSEHNIDSTFYLSVANRADEKDKIHLKCKCFKSLRKNEDPHQLKVSNIAI